MDKWMKRFYMLPCEEQKVVMWLLVTMALVIVGGGYAIHYLAFG